MDCLCLYTFFFHLGILLFVLAQVMKDAVDIMIIMFTTLSKTLDSPNTSYHCRNRRNCSGVNNIPHDTHPSGERFLIILTCFQIGTDRIEHNPVDLIDWSYSVFTIISFFVSRNKFKIVVFMTFWEKIIEFPVSNRRIIVKYFSDAFRIKTPLKRGLEH